MKIERWMTGIWQKDPDHQIGVRILEIGRVFAKVETLEPGKAVLWVPWEDVFEVA